MHSVTAITVHHEKVNFILKNSDLKLEDDKNLNLKNTVILGNFDINTHFLDIKNMVEDRPKKIAR